MLNGAIKGYSTSTQQRRIFDLVEKTPFRFNAYVAIQIQGVLDKERLRKAIDVSINRQEIFKTKFEFNPLYSTFLQVVNGKTAYEFDEKNLSPKNDLKTSLQNEQQTSFDLHSPIVRVVLFAQPQNNHVLSITLPSLYGDSATLRNLYESIIYSYDNPGVIHDVDESSLQYIDFCEWQAELVNADDDFSRKALQYWKERFAKDLSIGTPVSKGSVANEYPHSSVLGCEMPADLTKALYRLCALKDVSLSSVLLFAWYTLISRYYKRNVATWYNHTGRDEEGLATVAGLFEKYLPIKIEMDGKRSIVELIRLVQQLQASQNEVNHFFNIAHEFKKDDPYLPCGFDYHIVPPANRGANIYWSVSDLQCALDLFYIKLNCKEDITEHTLSMNIHYCSIVHSEAGVKNLWTSFTNLLQLIVGFIDDDSTKLQVAGDECDLLLKRFMHGQIAREKGSDLTVVDLFEQQAAGAPNSAAISFKDQLITYGELARQSTQFARMLGSRYHIKSGDRVAIRMERSDRMIIALLGILKSGALFLPLDINLPVKRLQHILEDAVPELFVSDRPLHSIGDVPLFLFSSLDEDIQPDMAAPVILPSDDAYCIYTSGTTGLPKGVMISHDSLANYLRWFAKTYAIDNSDKTLLMASVAYDLTYTSLWSTLIQGGTVRILEEFENVDLINLSEAIAENKITFLKLTPSHFKIFIAGPFYKKYVNALALRLVVLGGEPIDLDDLDAFFADKRDVIFVNHYGPTESTIGVVSHTINFESFDFYRHNKVIGKPNHNNSIHILDNAHQLVPVGVEGDIYIGGSGLARGYLNRPELTRDRFMDDPFSAGRKLYKSGDRGRWLWDGTIEYLGRQDDQVKIRGYRIELGEVEQVLGRMPGVEQAAVTVHEDSQGSKQLIGYIRESHPVEISALMNGLGAYLPDYMLPSQIIKVSSFAVTGNGKLDRKVLPLPQAPSSSSYRGARNAVEGKLVEVFESVLGRSPIGVVDNFFSLGGDSIKAIQVASRMHKAGYKLEVRQILQEPVIERLALQLNLPSLSSSQDSVLGEVELTPIQQYFFSRPQLAHHHYNQSILLEGAGLSLPQVSAVLGKVYAHHDALRMSFTREGEEIKQINGGLDQSLWLREYDYRDLSLEAASREMGYECEKLQGSFDLSGGALFKAALLHLPSGSRLFLVAHHLIIDGVSWRILLEDIGSLLSQYAAVEPLALPLKTDSYQAWSSALLTWSGSDGIKSQMEYWHKHASMAADSVKLPGHDERGHNYVRDTSSADFSLSPSLTELLLTGVHGAYHTEINDILLAGLVISLQRHYGGGSVLLGLEGHGREEVLPGINITRTVGWFTSLYPVVFTTSPVQSLGYQLTEVKEQLRSIPEKGIGYGVLRYLQDKMSAWHLHPEIRFNYLGQFDAEVAGSGLSLGGEWTGSNVSGDWERDCAWELNGLISQGQLQLSLTYNAKHYTADAIASFLDRYKHTLTALIEHCAGQSERHLTPSDLTYAGLTLGELESIRSMYKAQGYRLSDLYELSPLQTGLLYHSLKDSSGTYFEQVSYRIGTRLDIDLFRQSQQALMNRHAVLRTVFYYGHQEPLQVVLENSPLDFTYQDLRGSDPAHQQEQIEAYRAGDRRRGFDLSKEVSMRVGLLQINEQEYELIWSHHHIVMDGWCNGILIQEFWKLYEGYRHGTDAGLKQVRPYRDYIRWLRTIDQAASLGYWQTYLFGYDGVSGLPRIIGPGSYVQSDVVTKFGKRRSEGLRKLSSRLQVTLNTVIQSVWGLLLSRYSNREDVVFGSVVSGRPAGLIGVEEMIGLFINTIPVRVRLASSMTMESVVKQLQQEAIESQHYHYSQLAQIQSLHGGGHDLFDHIMIFENYPLEAQVTGTSEAVETVGNIYGVQVHEQTNYDLTVIVFPGEELMLKLVYNKSVYDAAVMERVGDQFLGIVDQLLESPAITAGVVELLNAQERRQQLVEFNATAVAYSSSGTTLVDLLEDSCRAHGNRVAVCFEDKVLTYEALNSRANQLSRLLSEVYQVKAGSIVGLLSGRSEEMIVGMAGILKSGCSYLPLDPGLPRERISYMLEDASVEVIVNLTDTLLGGSYKEVDLKSSVLDGYSRANVAHTLTSHDLAYVMYTSGSTGRPKGVMIEHGGVVNFMNSMSQSISIESGEKLLAVTTYAFDISVLELFWPLTAGASVVIAEKEQVQNILLLHEILNRERPHIMQATPSLWQSLFSVSFPGISPMKVLSGGEPLGKELGEKLLGLSAGLWNLYGPTETTIWSTSKKVENVVKDLGTIGKPIANTKVYILDDYRRLLPIGSEGDIYIGGAGLARGYLNRSELTTSHFISNPFCSGERIYKTGDRGRWTWNGEIEYLGRKDDQVKIRGHRIELGEIEHVLEKTGIAEQAVVTAWQDNQGNKQLVAYLKNSGEMPGKNFRGQLLKYLPEYMIPSYFIEMQAFPLTANGKLDKRSLPSYVMQLASNYEAPRNETERLLVEMWESVLSKTQIGIKDNFFALGGHSLKAMQIIIFIQRTFQITLHLSTFFKQPTIEQLAFEIRKISWITQSQESDGSEGIDKIIL